MELRTLAYFVAVAEEGSLLAASDVVQVTQPTLSRQLRQLERDLGVDLFRAPRRRLELTAAGREFLPVARDVLERAETARRLGAKLSAGGLAHVTISAPTTTLTDVIAPFLTTFGTGDPIPTIREADSVAALQSLDRETDLAMLTHAPPARLSSRSVGVPLWACVPGGHPWAHRTQIELTELIEADLLLLDSRYRARQILREALIAADLATPEHVECSSPQVAQALAAAGRGVAVVSDDTRFGLHPLLVLTEGRPITLRLVAAWRSDHHAARTLSDLVDRLAAFVGQRYPDRAAADTAP